METLKFEFPATKRLKEQAHVGVVGSGDLEVLLQPSNEAKVSIEIRTSIFGFEEVWKTVLERFFFNHGVGAYVRINDFGATPGMVTMRLAQALEVSEYHEPIKR